MINNGCISGAYHVSQGVRQGCPLSPYLLIFCAEVISGVIRDEKHIQCIPINNIQNKMAMYADDTNIITCNEKDLRTVIELFEKSCHFTGLNMNLDKTKYILRLGSLKSTDIKIAPDINIKWTNTPKKILGVNDLASRNEIANLNIPQQNLFNRNHAEHLAWTKHNYIWKSGHNLITGLFSTGGFSISFTLPTNLESVLFLYILEETPDRINRSTMYFPPNERGG